MHNLWSTLGRQEGRIHSHRRWSAVQEVYKNHHVGATFTFKPDTIFIHHLTSRSDDLQTESVAEICKGCDLPIHVKNLVFDGESYWHFKCFICSQCNSSLVNSKYYDKQGKLFCNNCFLAEHLPTCYKCGIEIKGKGEN